MSENERIIELLTRMEDNQRKALEAHNRHVQIAQAQLDRSNTTIQESIELQRIALTRQARIFRFMLPLAGVLLILLVYLTIKWRIL